MDLLFYQHVLLEIDIGGSQFMADKLKKLGKTYRSVKFPG
jgi:hypothetical protein